MISLRKQYPDGTLPPLRSSDLHAFNNIMIIKVPDHLLKPGDLKFQLASLDPTGEDSSWPADEIVKKLIPEYPMKERNNKKVIEQNSNSEEEVHNSVVANEEKHNLAFVNKEKYDSPDTRIHEKNFKNKSIVKSFKYKGSHENHEYKTPAQRRYYRPRQNRKNNYQFSNVNPNEWKNNCARSHPNFKRRQNQPLNGNLIERPSNSAYREDILMRRKPRNPDLIEPWLPNTMPVNTEQSIFPSPISCFNQPYNGSPLPTNQLGLLGNCPNDPAFQTIYPPEAAGYQPYNPNSDMHVQSTSWSDKYYEDNLQTYQRNYSHDMTQGPQNNNQPHYSHDMAQGPQNNNQPHYSHDKTQGPQNNNQPHYSCGMIAQEPENKINYPNNRGWMRKKFQRNGFAYRRNNKNNRRRYGTRER